MPLANERAKLFRDLLLQDQGLEKTKQNKTKQKQFQQKKKKCRYVLPIVSHIRHSLCQMASKDVTAVLLYTCGQRGG